MSSEQGSSLTEIRKIQLEQLELIKVFKNICEKEHLTYYMIAGTMLGAVRHKGYIPWDDDADFAMPREDYEKLLEKAPKYLKEPFRLENYLLDKSYIYYSSKLSSGRIKMEVDNRIKSRVEDVWIDIFPLDGMPDNGFLFAWHRFRMMVAKALYQFPNFDEIVVINKKNRSMVEKVLIFIGKHFRIGKLLSQKRRWNALDRVLKKYSPKTSNRIIQPMGYKDRDIHKKAVFGEGAFYEFEGMQLRGPKDYDTYLTNLYGDYMTPPPESERVLHGTKAKFME